MEIKTKNLENFILKNVNLDIKNGEVFALLGPNGAGKTTLLNAVSGLIPYDGNILFNNVSIDNLSAEKRNISYLFQDLSLFPHMTVFENVAYPLKTKINKIAANEKTNEILESMNLSKFANLYPIRLSGGEKQKIAIARALSAKPRILLLDEPFKSIDINTAASLREELECLLKKLKITTIYVTHSFSQAEEMADRLGILIDGKLLHTGETDKVLFSSHPHEVSNFIGSPNILHINSLKTLASGLSEAKCGEMKIIILPQSDKPLSKLAILSKDIDLSPYNANPLKFNQFKGNILDITKINSHFKIKINVERNVLFSNISKPVFENLKIKPGNKIKITLNLNRIKAGK